MQPSPAWRIPVTRFSQFLSYSSTSVNVMSLLGPRSITQMILFNLELRIRCLCFSFFHFGFLVPFIFFVQCPIHFSPLFPFLVKPWLFPLTNGKYRQFHSAESTGLFEMNVRVLTTCHTQYTWDRNIFIFFYLIEQYSKLLLLTV